MRTRLPIGARRALIYTHRWLGILGCLLFVSWFVSGIVLMYAGMPRLTVDERQKSLPPLDLASVQVPVAAAAAAGVAPDAIRIDMFRDRPVYRLRSRGRWTTVFADDGSVMNGVTPEDAIAEAARFGRAPSQAPRHDAYLDDADQWTFDVRASMPVHRVSLGDADGRVVYVADRTGEVVMDTTSAERRAAYAGAVLHWIYFTPFRRQSGVWAQTIIWSSLLGTVMCATGLFWGVWRYAPIGQYRLKHHHAASPYAGWMRWHHYAGLLFGLTTFTWIFSGLLSMDPWDWHPPTSPTPAQRTAFSGGPLRLDAVTPDVLRDALAKLSRPAEHGRTPAAPLRVPVGMELIQFRGEPFVAAEGRMMSALDRRVLPMFTAEDLAAPARDAMPDAAIRDAVWLEEYDAYYYDRTRELSLPVFRVRYADGPATWLYVDPRRGAVVRKEERLTRVNRWLYHGLHSLDFPFLYYRRPIWDIVVIAMSIGGLVSSVTTIVPALKRIRRRLHI